MFSYIKTFLLLSSNKRVFFLHAEWKNFTNKNILAIFNYLKSSIKLASDLLQNIINQFSELLVFQFSIWTVSLKLLSKFSENHKCGLESRRERGEIRIKGVNPASETLLKFRLTGAMLTSSCSSSRCATTANVSWCGLQRRQQLHGTGHVELSVGQSSHFTPALTSAYGRWEKPQRANKQFLTETDVNKVKLELQIRYGGMRWRRWLRDCPTSRQLADSIPDGVTGIFQRLNPSGRIVALGSTHPLTEMSTRNPSWG